MNNTIKCKYCGKEIEITEALTHQLKEEITKEILSEKQKEHEQEIEQYKNRVEKAEATELQLRKEKNQLAEEKKIFELEKQRQIDSERQAIRKKALEEFKEGHSLVDREKDKQIEDLKKAVAEAQRISNQKSQQLQGEVLELELEENLRNEFPEDEIRPIKKGSEGGDILQIVKARNGMKVGSILWETKRTKGWSDSWLPKLREDQRNAGASIAVINSITLPKNVETFKFIDNVWVTAGNCSIPLAHALRTRLLEVASYKLLSKDKDQTKELIFNYLTSETSSHRVEAQVEGIIELQNDLMQEQRALVKSWKKRELQHKKMINNLSAFYGELQAIMGNALPTVKTLELPDPDQAEENNKK